MIAGVIGAFSASDVSPVNSITAVWNSTTSLPSPPWYVIVKVRPARVTKSPSASPAKVPSTASVPSFSIIVCEDAIGRVATAEERSSVAPPRSTVPEPPPPLNRPPPAMTLMTSCPPASPAPALPSISMATVSVELRIKSPAVIVPGLLPGDIVPALSAILGPLRAPVTVTSPATVPSPKSTSPKTLVSPVSNPVSTSTLPVMVSDP